MKKLNRFLTAIVILLVLVVINYGFDLLLPVLKRSPLWHGILIAAGVVLLLFVPLLYLIEKHNRQNPVAVKILLLSGFFLVGAGVLLFGLSFWVGGVETLSFVLMGAALISWAAGFVIVFRTERKQKQTLEA